MENEKNILDKVANMDKKEVIEPSSNKNNNKKGRKVRVEKLSEKFKIEERDSELSAFVKELIIKDGTLTNKDVYDAFGRPEGWNMIYGLQQCNMSWGRLKLWCNLLGYEPEIHLKKIK